METAPAQVRGLSQAEADTLLQREGHNDLPSPEHHSLLALLGEVLREPMFALLVGSAVLYALIGDIGEAATLAAFASVSVSIALIQRGRSERVLEALRDLSSPRALVIRDGERRRIPGRDLVRGDVIVVTEGDRVPADAVLIEGVRAGMGTEDVRALTFVSLVAVNIAMIFSSRTFSSSVASALGRPNATLAWGIGIVGVLLAVIMGWSGVRGFFALGEMEIENLLLSVLVALAVLATLQFVKRLYGARLMT